MTKQPAVYILASRRNGTVYIGVTSDLVKRVWQHKEDIVEGFTEKYGVHTLVYYEMHTEMSEAILREKQLKKRGYTGTGTTTSPPRKRGSTGTGTTTSPPRKRGSTWPSGRGWIPAFAGMTSHVGTTARAEHDA